LHRWLTPRRLTILENVSPDFERPVDLFFAARKPESENLLFRISNFVLRISLSAPKMPAFESNNQAQKV
jgi:hypothetical protein